MKDLRKKVFISLKSAKENGYGFEEFSDEAISEDLCDYDSELEDVDPKLIEPFVKEWRKINGEAT